MAGRRRRVPRRGGGRRSARRRAGSRVRAPAPQLAPARPPDARQVTKTRGWPRALMSRTGPKVPDNSADDGHSAPPAALAKRCLANVITAGEHLITSGPRLNVAAERRASPARMIAPGRTAGPPARLTVITRTLAASAAAATGAASRWAALRIG